MTAAIRPDDWNLPLLVHVAGAMLLVGAFVVVLAAGAAALRGGPGAEDLTRLALRTLLTAALPGFVIMRVGAEWILAEEDLDDPAWVGVGYITSDGGFVLAVAATVVAWRAARRGPAGPGAPGRVVVVLAAVSLAAYAVAIWAMTAKPA